MPRPPLPGAVADALDGPHDAVMATLRPDGYPATVPCWYRHSAGQLFLSILADARRLTHIKRDPRVALSVIVSNRPYRHVSLRGRVEQLRADVDQRDIDALSDIYEGRPYHDRSHQLITAVVTVERWFAYGFDHRPSDRAP